MGEKDIEQNINLEAMNMPVLKDLACDYSFS